MTGIGRRDPGGRARRKRRGTVSGAWLGLGLSLTLIAAASAETLEDALLAAYSSNPDLLASRAELRAVDEEVPAALAGWLPRVDVSASYGFVRRRSSPSFSPLLTQQLHPVTASANLTQTLFAGGRTFYSFKRAKANVRAGIANLQASEQTVLLAAVTAYLNVKRDEAVLSLNRSNVEVLRREFSAARDRFEVGQLTRTDVSQAEARLSGARTQLTGAEAGLTASRAAYQRVVGHAPGTLELPPPLPVLPTSEDEALMIGLRENPTLLAAREREIATRLSIAISRGSLLPTVQVIASLEHSEQQTTLESQSDSRSVIAQVTWPLYQGGAEWAAIRQAHQTDVQAIQLIASAERGVVESVANAWEQLRSAQAQVQSSQEQVRANELAYEGVRQESQVGSRTTLDLLNAEQELLNAKVTLETSQRDSYVAGFQLLSAMGRLTAEGIGMPITPYNPRANYNKAKWHIFGWGTREPKSAHVPAVAK